MNSLVLRIAKSTPAVEEGFLAAGITIAGVAVLQAFIILLTWMA